MAPQLLCLIDRDAYRYLCDTHEDYVAGIQADLDSGLTPAEIRRLVAKEVGPDREWLARACEQTARHLLRTKAAAEA